MTNKIPEHNGIPISISLEENLKQEEPNIYMADDKKRLLYISLLAIIIGVSISCISKVLVLLINLFTNLSFYHHFSIESSSPAGNGYGLLVILIPVIGGVIVGLMSL
jgi:H+/Cl- antiporter ClcA